MDQELFDKGLKTRREVLGAEYVDAAISNADDFSRPMQELILPLFSVLLNLPVAKGGLRCTRAGRAK